MDRHRSIKLFETLRCMFGHKFLLDHSQMDVLKVYIREAMSWSEILNFYQALVNQEYGARTNFEGGESTCPELNFVKGDGLAVVFVADKTNPRYVFSLGQEGLRIVGPQAFELRNSRSRELAMFWIFGGRYKLNSTAAYPLDVEIGAIAHLVAGGLSDNTIDDLRGKFKSQAHQGLTMSSYWQFVDHVLSAIYVMRNQTGRSINYEVILAGHQRRYGETVQSNLLSTGYSAYFLDTALEQLKKPWESPFFS